jgi:predicted dehydrogenase
LADAKLRAEAGIHVLVEKPLADSSEAAWRHRDGAAGGSRFGRSPPPLGYPAVQQAREIVTGGEIRFCAMSYGRR